MIKANTPAIFRRDDVWDIGNMWKEGESCALIGIGSSGKSRLIQSFLKEDVQRFAFRDKRDKYLPIYVDGNGLLEDTAWGLYEEMLNSAITEIMLRRLAQGENSQLNTVFTELNQYHSKILGSDKALAYRWLTRAVNVMFMVGGFEHIIFLLDDIDRLIRAESLDPQLFRHLKSLRDHHKYRLCYTLALRATLDSLAGERLNEIDGFYKLVKSNTIPIGVYSWKDAELMMQHLMKRTEFDLSREAQTVLIHHSGQHPGLLRAMFFALASNQTTEEKIGPRLQASADTPQVWSLAEERRFNQVIRDVLLSDSAVQEQCFNIWEGLSEDEQVVLKRITSAKPTTDHQDAVGQLLTKRLLVDSKINQYEIFSPVFEMLVPQLKPTH